MHLIFSRELAEVAMLTIEFSASLLELEDLRGRVLGEAHLGRHREHLLALSRSADDEIVLLDFAGISSATASYLKAAPLTILRVAQASADDARSEEWQLNGLPPLSIFPMFIHLSDEVRHEVEVVLESEGLVCLEALEWTNERVAKARLLGVPDRAVVETLGYLEQEQQATAASLFEKYSTSKGAVTAFNNRLAELFRLRLARRVRQGRQWIYTPIAQEVYRG